VEVLAVFVKVPVFVGLNVIVDGIELRLLVLVGAMGVATCNLKNNKM
jgi:hypothetical protein